MGLDLSMTGSGLVVWNHELTTFGEVLRHRLLATEPLATDRTVRGLHDNGKFYGSTEERIEWQRRQIARAWRKYQPVVVGIEDYAFSRNMAGGRPRAELTGVVKNWLHRQQALVIVVGTMELKKFATGNGHADKARMVESTFGFWPDLPPDPHGKLPGDDNLADALQIARYVGWKLSTDFVESA